jgi:hypothetical protein
MDGYFSLRTWRRELAAFTNPSFASTISAGVPRRTPQFMSLPRCRHDIDFPSYVEVDKAYNPTCPPPSA